MQHFPCTQAGRLCLVCQVMEAGTNIRPPPSCGAIWITRPNSGRTASLNLKAETHSDSVPRTKKKKKLREMSYSQ